MTQHIIDTDELEKLPKYAWSDVGAVPCNRGDYVHIDDFRKLIANSPQADGMVLVPRTPTYEMETVGDMNLMLGAKETYKAMLSAYKPQADANTPPDVYDIAVDTGDGIYHTAEVLHFQQSGSKRMIQVRLGEPQADDVRKDAERYRWIRANPKLDICGTDEIAEFDAMIDRAIDKQGSR